MELEADASILLVLEDAHAGQGDVIPNHNTEALRMLWLMRSMQISRRDMVYLLPDLESTILLLDATSCWLRDNAY